MRKSLTILFGTAVLALSCSKGDPVIEPAPEQEDWVYDESLPVPITIGQHTYDAVLTKAAPITEETVEGTLFGVFGIDVGAEGEWSADAEQVVIYDKYARFDTDRMQFVSEEGDVKYYYPMITRYNYTFYGFHTDASRDLAQYRAAFNASWEGDALYAEFPMGPADILWAKASAEDISGKYNPEDENEVTLSGFNARYARYCRRWGLSGKEPEFNFDHLTAALHFWAVASDQDAETSIADKGVSIHSLRVVGVPSKARLCIAQRATQEGLFPDEGHLTAIGDLDSLSMQSADSFSEENLGAVPTVSGNQIGAGLFIVPQDAAGITVSFTLQEPSGLTNVYRQTIPAPSNGKFEAGKKYNFKIVVNSLEEITIRAAVNGWEDGFAGLPDENPTVSEIG